MELGLLNTTTDNKWKQVVVECHENIRDLKSVYHMHTLGVKTCNATRIKSAICIKGEA